VPHDETDGRQEGLRIPARRGRACAEGIELVNTGRAPLTLHTLHAASNHRDAVARHTAADAEADHEHFDGKTTE
jgi:hypothetical protein